jgi:hypothetical protein
MNERRNLAIAQWLAAVQPLQLLVGALFAFTLNAGFDTLERPAIAVAFFALAVACCVAIPLESWLVRSTAPNVSDEDAAARATRLQHAALLAFVVGATVMVVTAGDAGWIQVLRVACVLVVARIAGELWATAIARREARQR